MVRKASDFDSAFVAGAVDGDQAMLVLTAPVIDENRSRFVALAAGNRMPTIYEARQFVESGGLLSYGQVWRENFETAANEVWEGYSSGRVFLSRNQLPQRMFSTDPSCVGFFKDPSGDQHFGFFGEKIESTVICA